MYNIHMDIEVRKSNSEVKGWKDKPKDENDEDKKLEKKIAAVKSGKKIDG